MALTKEQSLYFVLEDYGLDGDTKPIVQGTGKRLVDMPGYWQRMKDQADRLMVQTAAYWEFFKQRDESKYSMERDIKIGGFSDYALVQFQRDFHVDVLKLVDEKNMKIWYQLTGIPGMKGWDQETVEDWIENVSFCINDKGTHEQFDIAKLYDGVGDSSVIRDKKASVETKQAFWDTWDPIILQVFLENTTEDEEIRARSNMFLLAQSIERDGKSSQDDAREARRFLDEEQRRQEDAFGRRIGAIQ